MLERQKQREEKKILLENQRAQRKSDLEKRKKEEDDIKIAQELAEYNRVQDERKALEHQARIVFLNLI